MHVQIFMQISQNLDTVWRGKGIDTDRGRDGDRDVDIKIDLDINILDFDLIYR